MIFIRVAREQKLKYHNFESHTSAKLNYNKKYREVRKEQNRLILLKEKENRITTELELKRLQVDKQKKRKLSKESQEENLEAVKKPKKKTDKEVREDIKLDEQELGSKDDQGSLV